MNLHMNITTLFSDKTFAAAFILANELFVALCVRFFMIYELAHMFECFSAFWEITREFISGNLVREKLRVADFEKDSRIC